MNRQLGFPTMNANLRIVFVLWVSAAAHLLCPGSAFGQLDSPIDTTPSVEDFLIKHRLSRLLLTYQESQARSPTGDQAAATEQLQRSYATELFKPIANPAWADQLLARAKMSLAVNPVRQSRQLRLAVAHREVESMRSAFLNGEPVTQIDRILDDLNSIQRSVKQQVDDLERLSELQQSSLGDTIRLNEQRQLQGHGEYLLGWSYFLLSASKQHQDRQVLRDAESSFRSYLGLPPYLNLIKFSEDKFGKENRFQRSAGLGLAVVMQAIGADLQAKHCFAIAEAHADSSRNSKREIENIIHWRFIGLLNQGDLSTAKKMIVDQPEIIEDTVILNAILNRTEVDAELTSMVMIELALSFQADRLRLSIEQSPDALVRLADLRLWIRGYLAFDDYQQEGTQQMLQLATETLQTADENFDEKTRPAVRGHCRFLLANCNLEQKNYFVATKGFLSATQLLRNNEANLAAEAAYRAFQTARMLPKDQGRHGKTIATGLIENFPQSRFAKLAKFELMLDQLNSESNPDAIKYLARYRTDNWPDIVVSAATVEIARRYQSSAEKTAQDFREFMESVNSDSRISTHAKIETNYHYLSALLALKNSADLENEIEVVLSRLQSLLNHPDSTKGKQQKYARYIYYQMLVLRALHPSAQTDAFTHFQQLQSLIASSPWTLATTIEAAKFFEDVEDSRFTTEPVLRQQMIDVYQALNTISASTESTNREVVEVKLAKLYLADGKIDAANELAKDVPKNASWLPILAELAETQGEIRRSEMLWQRLEESLPQGNDGWWEARLNRLRLLHKINADKANAMLGRTLSLYPEAPQSVSAKLQELGERWRVE